MDDADSSRNTYTETDLADLIPGQNEDEVDETI